MKSATRKTQTNPSTPRVSLSVFLQFLLTHSICRCYKSCTPVFKVHLLVKRIKHKIHAQWLSSHYRIGLLSFERILSFMPLKQQKKLIKALFEQLTTSSEQNNMLEVDVHLNNSCTIENFIVFCAWTHKIKTNLGPYLAPTSWSRILKDAFSEIRSFEV